MKERRQFIADYEACQWSMTELCERYGISRPTGYKWVRRHAEEGAKGLRERSRAPHGCPHETPAHIVKLVLGVKRQKRSWGARKILAVLRQRHPELELPARSTTFEILYRRGLTKKHRRRKKWKHPGAAPLETERPNQVWTTDFKGQFKLPTGEYCYPLTVVDHHSRYILRCQSLPSVRTEGVKPAFERLFREVGLPGAIRSDNGSPFASRGIHGLCQLNVFWMKLGIVHQRIQPSSPQQNGAHERMHKTLKEETTRPPARTLRGQQRKFDRWTDEFNNERPHESLGDEAPATVWTPSPRQYPKRLPKPEYPAHFEVRRVSEKGTFRIHHDQLFLSNALRNENIVLEEVEDGFWNIVYFDTLLGRIDERNRRITGVRGIPNV